MSSFRKLLAAVLTLITAAFIAANLYLTISKTPEDGRPYRVEINRLALEIQEHGLEKTDLSQCKYVYHIAENGDGFYNSDSDYMIREINGILYRFDYNAGRHRDGLKLYFAVNIILTVMSAIILGILFYIRAKILRPFERLTDVPYELSRGNLTMPVKENKSRFFGKFLWGIDLLRENIEQQKQRELEQQKEKKTLLLSLSHDIKTPLSAIKLYARALSKNLYADPKKQREIADAINTKADEIEEYVSQIITASREDFLSLEVNNREFYLSELIENIAAFYSEKLSLIKTDFIVGEYKNCLLSGDPDRAVEVLQNIMENAVKYGDGKQIELLFPQDDEGLLIAIQNSGCTLDKADLPHIFESFWRGSNAQNVHGSGLGLYICRQLMHRMNGEIFAEIHGEFITVTTVWGKA